MSEVVSSNPLATRVAFAGRRALVTGATRGIGRAIATQLASEGAQVLGVGRDPRLLASLREDTGCDTFEVDLRDVDRLRTCVQSQPPIDLLVNNAGTVVLRPILDLTVEEFDDTMAVNVRAALILAQEVARHLIAEKRQGAIVNVSSTASSLGQMEHTAYGASKAALDSLTRSLAVEFGPHGIRVNAVNPTVTLTDMAKQAWSDQLRSQALLNRIPLGRFAEPKEVADAVLYLLGDGATMINGVCLRVDGGHLVT